MRAYLVFKVFAPEGIDFLWLAGLRGLGARVGNGFNVENWLGDLGDLGRIS